MIAEAFVHIAWGADGRLCTGVTDSEPDDDQDAADKPNGENGMVSPTGIRTSIEFADGQGPILSSDGPLCYADDLSTEHCLCLSERWDRH